MKTLKARNAGFLACALALVGFLGAAPSASAQYPSRREVLSNSSYERMRQYAHELDEVARHASEQARAQQGGYRGFRRDTKFLKSIDHFADRAERFHERMDSYRTQPWNVDDEIEHLLRDARNVQNRLRRARFVDQHTAEDWDRAVRLLNQMASEYQAGISPYGTRYPSESHSGRYGNPAGGVPNPHAGSYDQYGYSQSGDIRQLARELDERAARANDLAGRYNYGYATSLRHFSDQARYFRDQVETGRLSGSELRSQVNHLLEDAQGAQDELRRTRVSSDLAAEWDGIVRVLTRMRDLAI
jgi:hypothetical protein